MNFLGTPVNFNSQDVVFLIVVNDVFTPYCYQNFEKGSSFKVRNQEIVGGLSSNVYLTPTLAYGLWEVPGP